MPCRSIFKYGVHLQSAKCVTALGAAVAVLAVGALLLGACSDGDQADEGSSDLIGTRKATGSNVTCVGGEAAGSPVPPARSVSTTEIDDDVLTAHGRGRRLQRSSRTSRRHLLEVHELTHHPMSGRSRGAGVRPERSRTPSDSIRHVPRAPSAP